VCHVCEVCCVWHTRSGQQVLKEDIFVHTATRSTTLHNTEKNAAHCSTLHHTATQCSTLQHRYHSIHGIGGECYRQMCVYTLHHTVPQYTTLQRNAAHCNTVITTYTELVVSATGRCVCTHCTTLYHNTPHCTALQHTATQISHHTRNWRRVLQADVCVHTAPYCTTIHRTAPHCSTLQRRYHIIHGIGGECYRQMCVYTLHHTVPHCTTLHHTDQTAPHCNTDITSYTEWAASAGMRVSRVWCCRCRVGFGSRASRGRKPFDLGGPPRYGKYSQT